MDQNYQTQESEGRWKVSYWHFIIILEWVRPWKRKKKPKWPSKPKKNSQYRTPPSLSSQEIEEKYVHLQTILMVTQLNCAYYEMGLSLQKVNSRLENNYRATKLMAFLKIYHYRPDTLDL